MKSIKVRNVHQIIYGGHEIVIKGTNFGNQSLKLPVISFSSSSTLCSITSISNNEIKCLLEAHEGGPVELLVRVLK